MNTVHTLLSSGQGPENLAPLTKGKSFLHKQYKFFNHLSVFSQSHLLQNYIDNPRSIAESPKFKNQSNIQKASACVFHLKLFIAASHKKHYHSQSLGKLSVRCFSPFEHLPYSPFWFSIFFQDYLGCQKKKPLLKKQINAPSFPFLKTLLLSITESRWIPKVQYLLLQIKINILFTFDALAFLL